MTATIVLCILSTVCFCLCLRGLLTTARSISVPVLAHRSGYSARAWRLARVYVSGALVVLAGLAFAGMINSYFELFG